MAFNTIPGTNVHSWYHPSFGLPAGSPLLPRPQAEKAPASNAAETSALTVKFGVSGSGMSYAYTPPCRLAPTAGSLLQRACTLFPSLPLFYSISHYSAQKRSVSRLIFAFWKHAVPLARTDRPLKEVSRLCRLLLFHRLLLQLHGPRPVPDVQFGRHCSAGRAAGLSRTPLPP